jgi:hypothetical protein
VFKSEIGDKVNNRKEVIQFICCYLVSRLVFYIYIRVQSTEREDGWLLAHVVYVLISEYFQPVECEFRDFFILTSEQQLSNHFP